MKTDFLGKRLTLHKETVAGLNPMHMAGIKGGCTTETLEETCATCNLDACISLGPFVLKTTANTCEN